MARAGKGLGWLAAFAAWAACIGVIAHYNIAPSLDHTDDASARALIGVQVLCTILLSLIQIDRGQHLSKWENASLSVLLVLFNVWAGMETANHINETTNGPNADKIAKAKAYQGQIDTLNGQIKALGGFDSTSAKQVEIAQNAVKDATWATKTCGRNCDMEAKSTALSDAQKEAAKLAAWQAKTEDRARLEKDLKEASDERAALGYVPEHANKTAALIASYLFRLGATADGVERWQPLARSFGIEMINRLASGFVFLFILGLFGNVQADAKAAADNEVMPGNVRAAQDPTSPTTRRTTRKRTSKDKEDVSGKIVQFPVGRAEDARALIAEGKTQIEVAELLGVSDRTIRRWLSALKADDSCPAKCPGVSGQDAVRDAA